MHLKQVANMHHKMRKAIHRVLELVPTFCMLHEIRSWSKLTGIHVEMMQVVGLGPKFLLAQTSYFSK